LRDIVPLRSRRGGCHSAARAIAEKHGYSPEETDPGTQLSLAEVEADTAGESAGVPVGTDPADPVGSADSGREDPSTGDDTDPDQTTIRQFE